MVEPSWNNDKYTTEIRNNTVNGKSFTQVRHFLITYTLIPRSFYVSACIRQVLAYALVRISFLEYTLYYTDSQST